MGVTVTGKLNKPAHQFHAGESVGFGIRIGVKYYDRNTKTNEWTNYKAVLFAKAPGQIQFLADNLIEGAIVEITGDKQKIEVYEGQQGPMYSIEILDAKIGYVGNGQNVQNSQPVHGRGGNAQNAVGYPSNHSQQAYAQPTGQQAPPQGQPMGAHQQQVQMPAQAQANAMGVGMNNFDDDIPFS